MTRVLLALLALFGIVAQSAPASARVDMNGVRVVAAQAVAARAVAACVAEVAAPVRPALPVMRVERGCGPAPAPVGFRAPTVHIGSDRSAR